MLFSIRLNTFSNGSFMMTHKALGNQKISSIAMNSWMSLKTIKNREQKSTQPKKSKLDENNNVESKFSTCTFMLPNMMIRF